MTWACLAAGFLLTLLSAVGLGCLQEFSRHDLGQLCRKRDAESRFREILRHDEDVELGLRFFGLFGTIMMAISLPWYLLVDRSFSAESGGTWGIALGGGVLLVWTVGVWFPRSVARVWAEPILYYCWPLWRGMSRLLAPASAIAEIMDRILHRLAGKQIESLSEESLEEEIREIIAEGEHEGLLENDAREMIEGIMELGDVDVVNIMTPRTDMIMMHVGLSWEEVVHFVINCGHTRIPVYSKNRDDIVGVLYAKDLLPELTKRPESERRPLSKILRHAYFVPESKPVNAVLRDFQQTRNHMAIVLDEYGGVSGLVTIEDVLEEIVGEIVDEYDKELVEGIVKVGAGSFTVLGRVHVDELNDRLALQLPEEDEYDTIGGYIFSKLGHIPSEGETVEGNGVRLTVTKATTRKIEAVRLEITGDIEVETA